MLAQPLAKSTLPEAQFDSRKSSGRLSLSLRNPYMASKAPHGFKGHQIGAAHWYQWSSLCNLNVPSIDTPVPDCEAPKEPTADCQDTAPCYRHGEL